MTITVAAFADATFCDRRVFAVGRAGLRLARHVLLGTVATATVGIAVGGFTMGVGWLMVGPPVHQERPYFGLHTIARVTPYPGEFTGEVPHFSETATESRTAALSFPVEVAALPPIASDAGPPPDAVGSIPMPAVPVRVAAQQRVVPMPPVAPPELASVRANQRLASLPPAPASRIDKPAAMRTLDNRTAVYDISERKVYLPSGKTLEAHSGLGDLRDNPRYIRTRNRGPTPPNTYALSLREQLFHGVRAIRLTPVNEDKMFGRDGMLAHTYMLGPNGDSNGCVSFKNYDAFLQAYLRGEVERLVVVETNGATLAQSGRAGSGRNARYASRDP
jgi:hypothetical protein